MKTIYAARNDRWQTLSARFGLPVCLLLRVNGNDPRLYPGRRLTIPPPYYCRAGAALPYTVQPDETLIDIAKRSAVTPWHIIRANDLKPPYVLTPAQQLRLPLPPSSRIITLSVLDTMEAVAETHQTTVQALCTLNELPEESRAHPGMQLYLPDNTVCKYCPV